MVDASEQGNVEALREALGAEATCQLEASPELLSGLLQLRATHRQLWDLEDNARSTTADDAAIARIKRAIDRANGARHQLIDRNDALIARPTAQPAARQASETVCELADRLIILSLKVTATARLSSDPSLPASEHERCSARLEQLQRWRQHLQRCLAQLLDELARGLVLIPPRQEFKLYNEPMLNPITRAELASANPHLLEHQPGARG